MCYVAHDAIRRSTMDGATCLRGPAIPICDSDTALMRDRLGAQCSGWGIIVSSPCTYMVELTSPNSSRHELKASAPTAASTHKLRIPPLGPGYLFCFHAKRHLKLKTRHARLEV